MGTGGRRTYTGSPAVEPSSGMVATRVHRGGSSRNLTRCALRSEWRAPSISSTPTMVSVWFEFSEAALTTSRPRRSARCPEGGAEGPEWGSALGSVGMTRGQRLR